MCQLWYLLHGFIAFILQAQGNSFITPAAVTVDRVENGISSINVSFFSDSRDTQFQTVHNFSVQTLLEEVSVKIAIWKIFKSFA